jgi:hypothetical protein
MASQNTKCNVIQTSLPANRLLASVTEASGDVSIENKEGLFYFLPSSNKSTGAEILASTPSTD